MNTHKLLELCEKHAKTKTQATVIMKNQGTYTAMREVDACLQLARKYPKQFTANQVSMFEVKFTINQ